MRKLGEVVSVWQTAGGHGESVKSIIGDEDSKLAYSAVWSVKIRASSVFISGPAGYQKLPEHAGGIEMRTTHGSGLACANCTVCRRKLLEPVPPRMAREKATENTMTSLRFCLSVKS
jgi:hypothetical protein